MFFYLEGVNSEAVKALQGVGLVFVGDELQVSDGDVEEKPDGFMTLRGVRLTKRQRTFEEHIDSPTVFDTSIGGLAPTGQDLYRCPTCGYWLGRGMSQADEIAHDRQCSPRYEWVLA